MLSLLLPFFSSFFSFFLSLVEGCGGRPLAFFEGRLGALQVAGRWSPLGAACFLDCGPAVEALLQGGADPDALFHRQGQSWNAMAYCQRHDKNRAYRALVAHQQALNDLRHASAVTL